MRRHAKATAAGSTEGSGKSRGLLRRAVVTRAARSASKRSGAPSCRRAHSLFAVLALAFAAFAISAAPASASNSEVGAITEVSYASAHVTGKVSASGFFNSATYEYSTDGSNWTTAFGETFFGAATNRVIAGTISVPKGETKYFVRLSLTSYGDNSSTSPSPYPSFTTLAVDPPAIPGAVGASPVFSTSATGTGKVKRPANTDPAFDVNCHFEYVTDAAYNATGFQNATLRACTQNPISGANAEPNVTGPLGCPNPVAEKPEGKCLAPETTYHLRLVAENASTSVVTKEAAGTFTTLPPVAKPVIGSTGVTEISKRIARGQGEVTRAAGEDPALDVSCHFDFVTEEQFTGNPSGEKFAGAGQAPCLGRNEVQVLTISATAGQFRLSANGMTTANIPYNVSAEDLRWALNDGGLFYYYDIRVEGGPGDGTGSSPYRITFPGGLLFPPETNIEQMTEQDGTTPLTGTANVTTPTNGASAFEFMNSPPTNQPKEMDAKLAVLQPNTTYHFRLVAENGGGTEIREASSTFKTIALIPPTLTVDSAEDIGYTSGNLTGTVDPGNQRAWGEMLVSPTGTEEWQAAAGGSTGETENEPIQFTAHFTSLKPGTTYQARLSGFNVEAYEYGEPFELTSAKPYPEFTTKGTSTPPSGGLTIGAVTDTTAHFDGTVDPHVPAEPLDEEGEAPYRTEWRIECLPACKNANGNPITGTIEPGESPAISPVAAGLESNAEYEATLIAHNVLGSFESTKTFKTTLVPPVVKATQGGSDGKGGYTIAGIVNPKGSAITNCRFDWGPTAPDYAFSAECSPLPQGRDEVQIVHMGSGPNFTLSFGGQTTGEITNGATPEELATALRGLSTIGPSGIGKVTLETTFTGYYYHVTFSGPLSATNLRLMTIHGIPGGEVYNEIEGGNSQFVSVEAHLSGLTPGVVYHYNLLATNAAGESETTDQEFVMTLAEPENCPNTQLRKENSSLALPECRAYEMVSAPEKEGFDALLRGFYGGERVHYASGAANIAKSGQGTLANHYVAQRTASGWETIPNLNGPTGSFYDAPSNVRDFAVLSAYSTDLLSSAWSLNRTEKPDPARFHQYLRKPDGSLEVIGAPAGGFGLYLQYSADLSHLATWFNGEYGPGVYVWNGAGGAPPSRVDLDNTGAPIATCLGTYGNSAVSSVSADGSRVVNYIYGGCGAPNPPVGELWARVNGTTAFEVSASHCNRTAGDPGGLCNGPSLPKETCEEHTNGYGIPDAFGCRNPKFIAATPDGSRVFFTTTRQLVNADTDQTNDIYACDLPPGNPTPSAGRGNPCSAFFRISGGATAAEVENVDTTSANGSMVMFTAKGVLASNEDAYGETAQVGDHNLYVWHQDAANPEGKTSFVGKLETYADVYGNIKLQAQATPDGAYGVFTTDSPLVEADTDISKDVYRVDASTGELTRVSISVLGAGGNGPFDAVAPTARAVSDDGQKIVFTTAEALSPLDGNAEPDAYLWTPKGVSLISTGAVKGGASNGNNVASGGGILVGIDGSGNDIYFPTYAPLTPADVDVSLDVYDARINGGFSFAKAQRCAGEACQPPSVAPQPIPASPANRPNGEGNFVPRTCPKGKVLKGSKCVKKPIKKHHKKTPKKKRHKKAGRNRGGSK